MHIICAMFGKGLGGLEQSLLDYCRALNSQNFEVTALIHPESAIENKLVELREELPITIEKIRNFGQWDLLAKQKIRNKIKSIEPDAIITFGNRALSLCKAAAKGLTPVIARTPNYNVERMLSIEGIFHTTNNLKDHIQKLGYPEENLHHIPNMVNIPDEHSFKFQPYQNPPVIGTMGRFVKKKGFEEFLLALSKLHEQDLKFKAVIGGTGEEEKALRETAKKCDLEDMVEFVGWVDDKEQFFKSIDIFCLPSLLEPFGIVLLEAFLYGKPVVTTNAEGPSEIATHDHDALVVPKGNANAMAEALKDLLLDQPRAEVYAINAIKTIKKRYDTKIVSEKLNNAIKKVVSGT